MLLKFSGSPEVRAAADVVWHCLMDAEFVAGCSASVQRVEALDGAHYEVTSSFGVGIFRFRLMLDVELTDVRPPTGARMTIRCTNYGTDLKVSSAVSLQSLSPERTLLNWRADAEVHGAIASIGARLMSGRTKEITENFWREFANRAEDGR